MISFLSPEPVCVASYKNAAELGLGRKVLSHCCNMWVNVETLQAKAYVFEHFEPHFVFTCKDGFGCELNPKVLRTKHLRAHWHDGR